MTITIIVALAITLYAYKLIRVLNKKLERAEYYRQLWKTLKEQTEKDKKDLKEEYEAFQKDMQEFISALPIKKTKKKTCNVKTVK